MTQLPEASCRRNGEGPGPNIATATYPTAVAVDNAEVRRSIEEVVSSIFE